MLSIRKNLHTKIFISFIIVIIISTVSIMLIWKVYTSRMIYQNLHIQFQNNVEEAGAYLDDLLMENEQKGVSLVLSPSVKELLNDRFDNEYEKLKKTQEYEEIATNLLNEKSGLVGVHLINMTGGEYNVGQVNIYEFPLEEAWMTEIVEKRGKVHYFTYETDDYKKVFNNTDDLGVLSMGRGVVYNNEVIGVIVLDISLEVFNEAFRYINESNNITLLLNQDNELLYTNTPMDTSHSSRIIETLNSGKSDGEIAIEGNEYITVSTNQLREGWKLISLVPFYIVATEQVTLTRQMFINYALVLAVALFLSIIIARSITKKIRVLKDTMETVQAGDLKARVTIDSKDEIGALADVFSNLMDDLNDLMIEVKNREAQKRLYELKSLQSQINPHFLYNTLNTIIYLADLNGTKNIEEITVSLIELLRAITHNDQQEISIKEELDYIRNYTRIQEYKYMGRFEINYDLEESCMEAKILKFILQPFVENALLHGIGDKEKIIIQILVFSDDSYINIRVKDNGIGMSEDKLAQVQSMDRTSASSVGIKNIKDRLGLYYEDYGFSMTSVEGLYTSVEIRIPKGGTHD